MPAQDRTGSQSLRLPRGDGLALLLFDAARDTVQVLSPVFTAPHNLR